MQKNHENKIAIVTSGGGMKCSYSAGVLCALADIYDLRNPDILIWSSGSTGSLAYYIAGQYDSIKNIWTNLLTSKKFISFKRLNKIMDVDYLVDVVFKQQEPLNIKRIRKSNSRLFISATEYKTGNPKFFTNADDIFEALRASKSIPVITTKRVVIDDIDYIDGSISTSFDINIEKAIKEGAKNIIVIKDNEKVAFTAKMLYYLYSLFVNKEMKDLLKKYYTTNPYHIKPQEDINMIIINPSKKLKIHSLENKKEYLEQSFFLWYEDLKNNNDLKHFFSNL